MSHMSFNKSLTVSRIMLLVLALLLLSTSFTVLVPLPSVSAQTQYVTATPGNINLGMKTNINVTGPTAGSYTVIVVKPSGTQLQLTETFSSAGQVQNAVFGNSTSGFKSPVDQVGTYNVFLEQGTSIVSSTSFYATNKLNVFMDMVNGGTCAYISGATRGTKMFPRFYVTYASNGSPFTNTTKGAYVTYNLPNGTIVNATWHRPNTISQTKAGFFIGKYQPNWNDTHVGPWVPTATFGDAAGNVGTYKYVGSPFIISPVQLSTNIVLVDANTNQTVAGLANGETDSVIAQITYPASAEPVPGFVGPLDSSIRGGTVTAIVGWGYYNATSATFGGKNPGGQIAMVTLTYTGKSGIWTGNFSAASLPPLKTGASYEVVVNSADKANPPNTGSAIVNVLPATGTAATSSTSQSTSSSQSTTSSTSSQVNASSTNPSNTIPVWAYAGTTIALVVGVLVGFLARKK